MRWSSLLTTILSFPHAVIAGFIPATHGATHSNAECVAPWVPGTSPRMTVAGVEKFGARCGTALRVPQAGPHPAFGHLLPRQEAREKRR